MVCTVPLVDSNYNIYGVCGFEISAMLFKLTFLPANNTYSRMFCMLAPYQGLDISINRCMFAGGYSVKDISKHIEINSREELLLYVSMLKEIGLK